MSRVSKLKSQLIEEANKKLLRESVKNLVRKVIKEDAEEEPKHSIPGTEGGHQFIPDNKADEEGMEQLRWEKLAKLAYDDGDEEISPEQEETVKEIKEELDEFLYGESTVEMMKNQVNILLNYL